MKKIKMKKIKVYVKEVKSCNRNDNGRSYIVHKVINSVVPHIGEVLSFEALNSMIEDTSSDRTVTIT